MRRVTFFIVIIASFSLLACGELEQVDVPPASFEQDDSQMQYGSNYDNSFYSTEECRDIDEYHYHFSSRENDRDPLRFMHYGGINIPFGLVRKFIGPDELRKLAQEGFPSKELSEEKPLIASKLNAENLSLQSWSTIGSNESYEAIFIDGVNIKVTEGPHFKKWTKRVDVYFRDGWGEYEEDFVGSWHEDTGWRYNECLNVAKYFDGKGEDHVFLKVWLKDVPKTKVRIEPRIHADFYYL